MYVAARRSPERRLKQIFVFAGGTRAPCRENFEAASLSDRPEQSLDETHLS